jgi:hypothetical protein
MMTTGSVRGKCPAPQIVQRRCHPACAGTLSPPHRAQWRCVACHCSTPRAVAASSASRGDSAAMIPLNSANPAPLPASDGCVCTLRSMKAPTCASSTSSGTQPETSAAKTRPPSSSSPSRTRAPRRLRPARDRTSRETRASPRPRPAYPRSTACRATPAGRAPLPPMRIQRLGAAQARRTIQAGAPEHHRLRVAHVTPAPMSASGTDLSRKDHGERDPTFRQRISICEKYD